MSDHDDEVPSHVTSESTGSLAARMADKLGEIGERLTAVETRMQSTPTHETVRAEVTGLRSSMTAQIVQMASKEQLATIEKDLKRIEPPSIWKLAAIAVTAVLTIIGTTAGIVSSASARVQDIVLQEHDLRRDVDDLDSALKRIEAAQAAQASKLDQLLLHQGAKP